MRLNIEYGDCVSSRLFGPCDGRRRSPRILLLCLADIRSFLQSNRRPVEPTQRSLVVAWAQIAGWAGVSLFGERRETVFMFVGDVRRNASTRGAL